MERKSRKSSDDKKAEQSHLRDSEEIAETVSAGHPAIIHNRKKSNENR